MKPLAFIGVCLLILCNCQPIENKVKFDKEAVINSVNTMFENFFNDIKAEGLIAEFKYLDRSEDFFWVPPGYNSALDYDSVRVIIENNARAYRLIEYQWDDLKIYPLSEEIVNYTGIVNCSMTDTSGIKTTISLIESGVLIKRGDGWKYLSGQTRVLSTSESIQY